MKFVLPDLLGKDDSDAIVADTFWENFYLAHTKTAMLVISVIVTVVFVTAEIAGAGTQTAGLSFGGTTGSNSVVTEEYNAGGGGTGMQVNISDVWKSVAGMSINIGDTWKSVAHAQINIGDVWKTIFSLLLAISNIWRK